MFLDHDHPKHPEIHSYSKLLIFKYPPITALNMFPSSSLSLVVFAAVPAHVTATLTENQIRCFTTLLMPVHAPVLGETLATNPTSVSPQLEMYCFVVSPAHLTAAGSFKLPAAIRTFAAPFRHY